jgi:broad specificity phosphatase PhoE
VHGAVAAIALASLAGCARPGAATTTAPGALAAPVYVVRHAEKAAQPADDPPLSDMGAARAAALAERVRDLRIRGIVVTNRLRTRLTALPAALTQRIDTSAAAGRLVMVPLGTDGVAGHAARVADTVRALARRAGGAVLVVGHSNTVGPIVRALGGPDYGELCDSEYARFFVVTPKGSGVETTRLAYGAADRDDPACGRMMRP